MATRLEYSVTAKCKPEHVWQKFHKLEEWPWWNRVVGRAKWLSGKPWEKGSQFLMDLVYPRKISFRPTIIEAAPPNRIGWVGKTTGFTGEHWFSFEAQPDGTTGCPDGRHAGGLCLGQACPRRFAPTAFRSRDPRHYGSGEPAVRQARRAAPYRDRFPGRSPRG